jgi:carboxylesterase
MPLQAPLHPATRDLQSDPRTQPFDLGTGRPVLLLHGFTGTPYEVRPLGEALARRGYRAVGPRLRGHATTPEALAQTHAGDWFLGVREELDRLPGPVHLVGLSVGAMLALLLARDCPDRIASLTLLAPAAQFRGQVRAFFQLFRIGAIARRFPFLEKSGVGMVDREFAASAPSLPRVPTHLAVEVLRLIDEARSAASAVRVRSLICYGGKDQTVSGAGVRKLVAHLQPPPDRVLLLARSGHLLPLDVERETLAEAVGAFIVQVDTLKG